MIDSNNQPEDLQNNKCEICYQQFNKYQRIPLIICNSKHTICQECMNNIDHPPKCPYCREYIEIINIIRNNYILSLLPHDPSPNQRTQTNYISYYQQQYSIIEIDNSINDQILVSNNDSQYNSRVQLQLISQEEANLGVFMMWEHNPSIFGRDQDSYKWYYNLGWIQLPYLIFDWYFILNGSDEQCYDYNYLGNGFNIRSWLLGMGVIQIIIIGMLFLKIILKIYSYFQYFYFILCIDLMLQLILKIKIVLWIFIEIILFLFIIAQHCNGGIYLYGIIQTIIYIIILLIFIGSIIIHKFQ